MIALFLKHLTCIYTIHIQNSEYGFCFNSSNMINSYRLLIYLVTIYQCKLVYSYLNFLSSQSSAFVQGIVIISAHMAKGLEFDEVIIPQVDDRNYHSEIDRSMLYVAVTRAMHRLTLTYSGTKHTPFI